MTHPHSAALKLRDFRRSGNCHAIEERTVAEDVAERSLVMVQKRRNRTQSNSIPDLPVNRFVGAASLPRATAGPPARLQHLYADGAPEMPHRLRLLWACKRLTDLATVKVIGPPLHRLARSYK